MTATSVYADCRAIEAVLFLLGAFGACFEGKTTGVVEMGWIRDRPAISGVHTLAIFGGGGGGIHRHLVLLERKRFLALGAVLFSGGCALPCAFASAPVGVYHACRRRQFLVGWALLLIMAPFVTSMGREP